MDEPVEPTLKLTEAAQRTPAVRALGGLGRRVLIAAGLVVVFAGLKYAEPFLVPVVLGVMVAAVSSPLAVWLVRKGAPSALGAAAVLVLDIAVLGGITRLLLLAAGDLQDQLPTYVAKVAQFSHYIEHYLNRQGLHDVAGVVHTDQAGPFIQGAVGNFASMTSHIAVVAFVAFFALCEISGMGDKLRLLTNDAELQFERVDQIVRQVQLYVMVKFWTSLMAGVCAYVLLRAVGVHLALLLALSLFLLHFIPNIGTAIATVPAVLFALADKGPGSALTVGIAYLLLNTLIGNLIEPRMLGTRLGVSPFVVLLGMLFWGFMWGPTGALLSVPILVATKIVVENIPELAWLGVLAGATPRSADPELRKRTSRVTMGLGFGVIDKHAGSAQPAGTIPGFRFKQRRPAERKD
jgi:predicted PurR-regulated permease PerM